LLSNNFNAHWLGTNAVRYIEASSIPLPLLEQMTQIKKYFLPFSCWLCTQYNSIKTLKKFQHFSLKDVLSKKNR
jgi:hypothetical protein